MLVSIATVLALTGAACASSKPTATRTVKVETLAPRSGPVLLAQFDTGIGAVTAGSSTPLWQEHDSVAALDGSAVFTVSHDPSKDSDRLERLDLRRGGAVKSWPLLTPGLAVNAVAPSGRWVALTDRRPGYGSQARTSTTLVVYDTRAGAEAKRVDLTGDVQPEAFSADGTLVFALSYSADHYRVQTIELLTGERYDTSDRDKRLPPEDMHGHAVHGVLSRDHELLATLYRNPGDAKEPGFVHVLDLAHGWSYCADLPAPFGTGPAGTDAIELTSAGTLVVAANSADRVAEIHIDDVRT
ncbi:MAG: hypothetical protein JWM72_3345, partial [Actinomycetia bacterium]|nr:hypothetical protein [Actinomycetes bacterium]